MIIFTPSVYNLPSPTSLNLLHFNPGLTHYPQSPLAIRHSHFLSNIHTQQDTEHTESCHFYQEPALCNSHNLTSNALYTTIPTTKIFHSPTYRPPIYTLRIPPLQSPSNARILPPGNTPSPISALAYSIFRTPYSHIQGRLFLHFGVHISHPTGLYLHPCPHAY